MSLPIDLKNVSFTCVGNIQINEIKDLQTFYDVFIEPVMRHRAKEMLKVIIDKGSNQELEYLMKETAFELCERGKSESDSREIVTMKSKLNIAS